LLPEESDPRRPGCRSSGFRRQVALLLPVGDDRQRHELVGVALPTSATKAEHSSFVEVEEITTVSIGIADAEDGRRGSSPNASCVPMRRRDLRVSVRWGSVPRRRALTIEDVDHHRLGAPVSVEVQLK